MLRTILKVTAIATAIALVGWLIYYLISPYSITVAVNSALTMALAAPLAATALSGGALLAIILPIVAMTAIAISLALFFACRSPAPIQTIPILTLKSHVIDLPPPDTSHLAKKSPPPPPPLFPELLIDNANHLFQNEMAPLLGHNRHVTFSDSTIKREAEKKRNHKNETTAPPSVVFAL
jgi:hypothetical protein